MNEGRSTGRDRRFLVAGALVAALLLAAVGLFAAMPFKGALEQPECPGAVPAAALGPNARTTEVDVGAVLTLGSGSVGVRGVGTQAGVDAVRVSSAASGPTGCVLRQVVAYRVGDGVARLDAIAATSPWQDLTSHTPASARFTVS